MVKERNEHKENDMTTWQDIQAKENPAYDDNRWGWASKSELKKLRKEFMQDARDSLRYGSYDDYESYQQDVAEINEILGYS
jgi:hypothetical protein